jgi:CubicO group peptidase (beta-lactamase class C family)
MLERCMNASWEDLMKKHVFQPLDMKTASFGPPGKPGRDDQPLGHNGKSSLVPVEVGIQADNPPSIGPGGTVHCSLGDLLRYAQWHAGEPDAAAKLVMKPETRARLYEAPSGGDYAFGWRVTQRPWAHGIALTHNGTNTMWFAVIWVSPARKAAFAAVTNAASATADKACDSAVAELIKRHLP